MKKEDISEELRTWSKPKKIKSSFLKTLIVVVVTTYFVIALRSFEIDIQRMIRGFSYGQDLIFSFLRPDFVSRGPQIFQGILETLAMAIVATIAGCIFAIPISLGAAKNLVPLPVYLICRGILMLLRSLHVVVLAILFVVMIGFGPLAGVLTMFLNSIGFVGKLLSEEIENIRPESLEAIKSAGASWPQLIVYGVWPQISSRYIGISIYRYDISFRQSSIIGIVGAGGIGNTLMVAMDRFDFGVAAAILLIIIAFVLVGEQSSSIIRQKLIQGG